MSCMWPGENDEDDAGGPVEEKQVETRKVDRTGEMVSIFHYEKVVATYSTQINSWLYLGNARNAASKDEMMGIKGHVMTHCLNCRQNGKTPFKGKIDYLVLVLVDEVAEDLIKQVNIAYPFFEKVRAAAEKGGSEKLLIHCDGINDGGALSRSTAILIGCLMKWKKIKYRDAALMVKQARDKQYQPMCKPNHGFIQQLKKMYKRL